MAVYSNEARVSDFLGEGADESGLGDAPALTEEERQQMRARAAQRDEQARLADVPYGTPASQGGTATQYTVTDQGKGGVFKDNSTLVQRVNPDGTQTVVADYSDKYPYSPTNPGPAVGRTGQGSATPYTLDSVLGDGAGGGNDSLGTGQIQEDAGVRADEGKADRENALQSVIDRFQTAQDSFSTQQQDQSRQAQQQAIQQNRELFARAMGFDRDAAAARYSDEALANSLAIARSAPGGASRASALFNALESQPAQEAEAQRQANAEGRQQENVALQAAGQLGQQATQTRSQDEAQAEAYTGIGLDVAKSIANMTGQNLQLDQRDREFLGEVALQAANLNLDVQKLGVDEALRQLEIQLQKEGLDQEWKMFKQSQKITGKDVLGGIFGLTGGVVSSLFTGLAAKK